MTERLLVKEFIEKSAGFTLADVRSPGEYSHAHIPGAVNIPLFSDEQRKVVGTLYKEQGRESAIKAGLDFFGLVMRDFVEQAEQFCRDQGNREKRIFLYCWRGGMRSRAMSWLFDLYGFRVTVLAGGYKSFRRMALEIFKRPFRLNLVGGYTGSGKTEVLHHLVSQGKTVIDLERIASHKGSAFGNINMPPQPSQEMFENLLAMELDRIPPAKGAVKTDQDTVWIEDESQRIGTVNIPMDFWNTMRQSRVVFLDIPFQQRLEHILAEYGGADRERLANAIGRISKRLGGLDTKNALAFLESGDLESCFRILLRYYDKHYLKGLHNREGLDSLLTSIPCRDVTADNALLLSTKPIFA